MREILGTICIAMFFFTLISCESFKNDGQSSGMDGSHPVNKREEIEYKKALLRCHKTGGTRVVKIKGQLRCY